MVGMEEAAIIHPEVTMVIHRPSGRSVSCNGVPGIKPSPASVLPLIVNSGIGWGVKVMLMLPPCRYSAGNRHKTPTAVMAGTKSAVMMGRWLLFNSVGENGVTG
jgi:hypothetical protein